MNYSIIDLQDFVQTFHEIHCTNCRHHDKTTEGDDYDAANKFFGAGWRGTTKNVYCPKCAKKKLKQEKNDK